MISDRLDGILADMVADVPGAVLEDLKAELAHKVREFCFRSRVWRTRRVVEGIRGGLTKVPLENGETGPKICTLDRVWINGGIAARMGILTQVMVDQDGGDCIFFSRCPVLGEDETWTFAFDASMMPNEDFAVPEWIYAEFGDAIGAGVVARFKRRLGRQYTDRDGAVEFEAAWRRGIAEASTKMSFMDGTGAVAPGTEWTVNDGNPGERVVSAMMTYGQLLEEFRTLVADLTKAGFLQGKVSEQ